MIIDTTLGAARAADPDTHRQWARLQARISAEHSEAALPRRRPLLAAASAVGVVAIAVAAVVFTPREPLADRYVTARGEQTSIVLADSSAVTLNHTSELAVRRFGSNEPRRMTLSGEALFRVQRNETPFIVSNGFAEVSVLGTEFNVRSRDGVLEVSVLHGTVRVGRTEETPEFSLILQPGQRAIVGREAAPVRIEDIASQDFPGWMHGKLFLTRASLEEACREVEARFDVSVRVVGASSNAITGVLDATNADVALRSLGLLTGKELSRDHGAYVLE